MNISRRFFYDILPINDSREQWHNETSFYLFIHGISRDMQLISQSVRHADTTRNVTHFFRLNYFRFCPFFSCFVTETGDVI